MKKETKISCLPKAGIDNPYQHLMIEGLNISDDVTAISGIDDRFLGILRTAIKQKPDYIHFDWITSYYYRRRGWMTLISIPIFVLQVWVVRYILGVKLVWTLHNIQPHDSSKALNVHRFCRGFFAKQMDWIRIFSEDSISRAEAELKVKNKFVVCPEGSYIEYYKNETSPDDSREKLGYTKEDVIYLYLGFIKPYKGIEELIDSFMDLDIPNKKLIIAGRVVNKAYFDSINKQSSSIKFINRFIENDELQYFYNTANVVVLPFKKVENSGSVILAMGFKKVVISPDMGVLVKRLVNQREFLFTNNLKSKMELAYSKLGDLNKLGNLNFQELERNKWEDFATYFKNDDKS